MSHHSKNCKSKLLYTKETSLVLLHQCKVQPLSQPALSTSSEKHIKPYVIQRRILLIIGLVFFCLIALPFLSACKGKKSVSKLTFALPVADWWTASPFIISQSSALFKEQGLELESLTVPSGLASKNAVVAGTADIGLCAATPLALAAAKREGLVVLGTYLKSSAIIGLVRPREMEANARPPEPIAIVTSTISESYLYQYLSSIGEKKLMEQKKIKQLHQRPGDIPASIKNGSARSAVIWEPFLSFSAEQPGFVVDRTTINFQVNLYLITRPEIYKDRKNEIDAFLEGVKSCCYYLRENSENVRQEIEQHFDFRANFLESVWNTVEYGLTYDLSRMEAEIIREAEVAKALGYISETPDIRYFFEAAQ